MNNNSRSHVLGGALLSVFTTVNASKTSVLPSALVVFLFGLLSLNADQSVDCAISYEPSVAGEKIVLRWNAVSGKLYTVLAAPNLGGPWSQAYATNATSSAIQFRDQPNLSQRFYRVVIRESDAAILTGRVSDAVNGQPLAGVNVTSGGFSAMTDASGNYTLQGLSAGTVQSVFSSDVQSGVAPLTVRFQNLAKVNPSLLKVTGIRLGYQNYTNSQVLLSGYESTRMDFAMSPANVGKYRIVLNWGAKPRDLDAHLSTPLIEGKSYLVSYIASQKGSTNAAPYAQFDVDRTDGYGPETITISRLFPGTYRYYVHNYIDEQGDTGPLKNSKAIVQIYGDQGLAQTIYVPTTGEGYYWDVCTMDGSTGKIAVNNRISGIKPASVSTEEQIILSTESENLSTFEFKQPILSAQSGLPAQLPITYLWSFGDGTTSTNENPVKIYGQPGVYDVSLTVRLAGFQDGIETKSRFITVSSPVTSDISISVTDASSYEGSMRGNKLQYSVRLSKASSSVVKVNYSTQDDTATAGVDYEPIQGTLTFNPGEISKNVIVTILGDLLFEDMERIFLNLSNPINAILGDDKGSGYIIDEDPFPQLTISDGSMTLGGSGQTQVMFVTSLRQPSGQTVSVGYFTRDGSAVSGLDYVKTNGTITFAPGETNKTNSVIVLKTATTGANKILYVQLTNEVGAIVADDTGIMTITEYDFLPKLRITNAIVAEGHSGLMDITFKVSLSAPAPQTVRASYETMDVTARAGIDYLAASGQVVFAAGETNQNIIVKVNGDTLNEADETFTIQLSQPQNAIITTGQATGTIANDDPMPTMLITQGSVMEGDFGTTNMVFSVILSKPSGQVVGVQYATADGTALAGKDYIKTNGMLTFSPGIDLQNIVAQVLGDKIGEVDETFYVDLVQPAQAVILEGMGRGEGTIMDNDLLPQLTITDAVATEGNRAIFTVRLSMSAAQSVSVPYNTMDGTALAGTDYTAQIGAITFPAGVIETNIIINTLRDTEEEAEETFYVRLSQVGGIILQDVEGTGTIVNRRPLVITQQPVSVTATNGSDVTLSVEATGPSSLQYQWRRERVEMAGKTNAVLVLTNVQTNDSGSYAVAVSADGQSIISQPAIVTVLTMPTDDPISGMVRISPGAFTMGSPSTEKDRDPDEGPLTSVRISKGFWMGKCTVTQKEYLAVMGSNPSYFTGDLNRPVESVTWYDATNYCGKFTQQERAAGRLPAGYAYRLPTEAEWEYACRAGTTTRFYYGDDLNYTSLGDYAWFYSNSSSTTHPVGQKFPNSWGLYDMHGNVWEWCLDWWSGNLPGGSVTDPKGPVSGSNRVIRGGGWSGFGWYCRSAIRYDYTPGYKYNYIGFRIVLAPAQ